MRDGQDASIRTCADPNALPGRGTMRGVVGNERPRQHDFDRTTGRLRSQRCHHRIGAQEQLAAEAAADVRRHEADVVLGDAKGGCEIRPAPVYHLVGRPHRQLVAVPRLRSKREAPSSNGSGRGSCRARRASPVPERKPARNRRCDFQEDPVFRDCSGLLQAAQSSAPL